MNLELVEKVVALLDEYPVSEIGVEAGTCRVHVRRPLASAPIAAATVFSSPLAQDAAAEELSVEAAEEARVLTAPMVGIFYHTEPPLSFAVEVQPGQIVGSIESMKLMNDVAAEAGGRVTDILVEDGAPVEYGQTLFRLAAF